ncbi:FAD binding domain-containing protein [Hydrogenoanaerobacterium sp.]|uniref:FAD binding domain-containing protein n=1 Tax=Hydrogenoanaerobacterium sp. TaxID=2953763 RepID=UPI0028A1E388|nr:FAD binding domain-containing protein [Hydrogenoanaerobacterium sp.]
MYTIKSYQFAQSLDEACELLQKDSKNAVLGGCCWLKMGHKKIRTAIDLSRLDLSYITEGDGKIYIGATTTLRELETSPLLQKRFGGILPQCVHNIVGVQFRNMATVGASVFSRYGFSDIITALLALDTSVELHLGGVMPLEEFIALPPQRDILKQLIIADDGRTAAYQSMRNTATDFPVLAVAAGCLEDDWKISVGARPACAALAVNAAKLLSQGASAEQAAEAAAKELTFGDNLRASAEYRRLLAEVLVKRAVQQCREEA